MRDIVTAAIDAALKKLNIQDFGEVVLNHPQDPSHGDYATPIPLQLAKKLGRKPMEIAQEIADAISGEHIQEVKIAPPGFINIFLTKKALLQELTSIIEKGGTSGRKNGGATILLEFGQPNTHKAPHIGHLFSYVLGESLARVQAYMDHKVIRANYQGDIGPHVAKCLYVLQNKQEQYEALLQLRQKVDFLQECYQEGSKLYENEEEQKKIDALTLTLYRQDESITKLWKTTREDCLTYYKEFEAKLGIKFDKNYFESETSQEGKEIVEKNVGHVFEKSDGAIVFKGEEYGLHTRVFVNKHGNPTYEGKEIGLYAQKIKDFKFDQSVITTANEQNEYHKVVIRAAELVFPILKGKITHIGYGMVNLTSGKMSSRSGEFVGAFSLFDDVTRRIEEDYKSDKTLSETIAAAAIKYSFLHSEARLNKSFDIQKSIARIGDCGPYLLYTYVRCMSVLQKEKAGQGSVPHDSTLNDVENVLLRSLYQFPEIVEKAATLYAPHLIAQFLYELSRNYNNFYQSSPILSSQEGTKQFRLALTRAVSIILKEGLYLLGIETVERM